MTTTTTASRVWPCFVYQDARAAINFLITAFGFTTAAVVEDGPIIRHAELRWKGAPVAMLSSADREDSEDCAVRPTGRNSVYLVADSAEEIDALFAQAEAAGASVVREPFDTPYGSHEFAAADPEGNLWNFGT
jgi:uncharacterized glyoxalase superfamily protein PhnB